jgi:hypothetical protein
MRQRLRKINYLLSYLVHRGVVHSAMAFVYRDGQLQVQIDDDLSAKLAEFAADAGGTMIKGAATVAVVAGTGAALAGAGTAGTTVAAAGGVALGTAAVMDETIELPKIDHLKPMAEPEEGITLRISDDMAGRPENPLTFASNDVSKALAESALERVETTDARLDQTYAKFRELLPVMQNMGIQLEDCTAGTAVHHGCSSVNMARQRNTSPTPPRH